MLYELRRGLQQQGRAEARRGGFALCLAAGFLLSCRVVVVPPPPGPPVPVDVATGDHTYAELLREAERIAATKDPAKREAAYRQWEAELEADRPPEIDWSLLWLGLLLGG